MKIETDTSFHQSQVASPQPNKGNIMWPFVGAKGTVTELLWKVTPVHYCIELCQVDDKT